DTRDALGLAPRLELLEDPPGGGRIEEARCPDLYRRGAGHDELGDVDATHRAARGDYRDVDGGRGEVDVPQRDRLHGRPGEAAEAGGKDGAAALHVDGHGGDRVADRDRLCAGVRNRLRDGA